MITTAFFSVAYFLISKLISVFGSGGTLPAEVHEGAVALGGYVGIISPIFPVATLATCVGIAFTVEIAIFGFKTFKSFASHLPWIGGR